MCSRISEAITESKLPSGYGRASASPTTTWALADSGASPACTHRLQDGVDVGQFLGVLVEGDHVGAAAVCLEAVPSGTAADVDHLGARPDSQPVVVNGQHGSSTASMVVRNRPVRAIACS